MSRNPVHSRTTSTTMLQLMAEPVTMTKRPPGRPRKPKDIKRAYLVQVKVEKEVLGCLDRMADDDRAGFIRRLIIKAGLRKGLIDRTKIDPT